MSIVFRKLFIVNVIFYSILLSGANYDDDILYIYSKIMPRFVLMSNESNKLKSSIDICIVSEAVDKIDAMILIDKANKNYPNGIKNYKLNFIYTDYTDIDICKNSELMFLFNSNDKNIKKLLKLSIKNKILTVSYDKELLKNGIDISLFLGRKIIPYINIKSIRKKGIKLNNVLLRISKIYLEGGG